MSGVGNALDPMEVGFNAMDGGWAAAYGQTFQVFRLNAGTPPQGITFDAPVIPSIRARVARMVTRDLLENETFVLLSYDATVDSTDMQLQDIIQEIGPGADGSIYTFAQHRITRKKLWMRTEALATITRPEPLGGRVDQEPTTGAILAPGYLGDTYATDFPLVLNTGQYAFVEGGQAVHVPVGIQDNARVSGGDKDQAAGSLPTKLPDPVYMAYVPNLPGVDLQPLDVLHVGRNPLTGSEAPQQHYQVSKMLNTGTAGLTGYICICTLIQL